MWYRDFFRAENRLQRHKSVIQGLLYADRCDAVCVNFLIIKGYTGIRRAEWIAALMYSALVLLRKLLRVSASTRYEND